MPVTFAWEAGPLAGLYTFESETVGRAHHHSSDAYSGLDVQGELRYVNAITGPVYVLARAHRRRHSALFFGTTARDLALALYRGPWGS